MEHNIYLGVSVIQKYLFLSGYLISLLYQNLGILNLIQYGPNL